MALNARATRDEAIVLTGEDYQKVASSEGGPETKLRTEKTNVPATENPTGESDNADITGDQVINKGKRVAQDVQADAEAWAKAQPDYDRPLKDIIEDNAVNGLDREDTLKLARLADALNSRDWSYWKGGAVNARGDGTNVQGGLQGVNVKEVDTAESRAQGLAEQLAGSRAEKKIELQHAIQKFPYIAAETLMRMQADLGADASRLFQSTFMAVLNTALSERFAQFQDREKIYFAQIATNAILQEKNDVVRGYMQQLLGQSNLLPYATMILNNLVQDSFLEVKKAFESGDSTTFSQKLEEFQNLKATVSALQSSNSIKSAQTGLSSAAQQFRTGGND